jgi:hypothetical protein
LFDRVESEFAKGPVTAHSVKLYLCRNHSAERPRTIGAQSGAGDAAVAQSCKRFNINKTWKRHKTEEKMERFEKRVFLSNVETWPFRLFPEIITILHSKPAPTVEISIDIHKGIIVTKFHIALTEAESHAHS